MSCHSSSDCPYCQFCAGGLCHCDSGNNACSCSSSPEEDAVSGDTIGEIIGGVLCFLLALYVFTWLKGGCKPMWPCTICCGKSDERLTDRGGSSSHL